MTPALLKMKWADTILFDRALNDVRQLTGATPGDWQNFLREREAAAYERGRRDGESALNEQLIRQRNEMVEIQRGIFESLQKVLPQVVHEAENSLIELALETAKKIVAGIEIDSAMLEGSVREALRQCEGASDIVVQLHPDDLALLRQNQSSRNENSSA